MDLWVACGAQSGVGTWTCGFFPATLWKLYNYTTAIGDASAAWWRQQAQLRTLPIAPEENDTTTHDIGFMLFYTFGQGFDLTGDSSYRDVVFTGAGSLATRFVPAAGVIRSWNGGPGVTTIIDNMMNLPLLWWSGIEKGNQTWTQMAESHSNHMISDGLIREDGCAYHVIIYNETTGAVLSLSSVPQGFNATSIWSRGQGTTASEVVRWTGDRIARAVTLRLLVQPHTGPPPHRSPPLTLSSRAPVSLRLVSFLPHSAKRSVGDPRLHDGVPVHGEPGVPPDGAERVHVLHPAARGLLRR